MPEPDRVVVSDTGPFITLERLPGGFKLLRQLYDRVLLPERVLAELAAGRPPGDDYLQEFGLADFVEVVTVQATDPDLAELDAGERDALSLALGRGLPLLIEERIGRDIARAKGCLTRGSRAS
jgi:predicted nucleic acid-binding protein